MGSHAFVDESKENGWLATLGCCAPSKRFINEVDDEAELRGRTRSLEASIFVYEQPQAVVFPTISEQEPTTIPSRPLTSYSMGQAISSWVDSSREFAARASSRASTMRSRTWTGVSQSKSSRRPTISGPTDFRHLNESDALPPVRRRTSFRPLELSIYLPDNRLSPLPDFDSDWEQKLPSVECPPPALLRSRPPSFSATSPLLRKPVRVSNDGSLASFGHAHSRSSSRFSMMGGSSSISGSRPMSVVVPWIDPLSSHPPTPPAYQTEYPSPSAQPLNRSSTVLSLPANTTRSFSRVSSSPSPLPSFRSRAITEPPRPLQKRSSVRRPALLLATSTTTSPCDSSSSSSVDDAIRELNTIVEEKRAAERAAVVAGTLPRSSSTSFHSCGGMSMPPASPSHHIPAIAPSLRMHVRSETLSDIGSAFSVPLSSKPLPSVPASPFTPGTVVSETIERRPLVISQPYETLREEQEDGMVEGVARPSTSTTAISFLSSSTTSKSRLSLWFRRHNRQSRKQTFDNDSITSTLDTMPLPPQQASATINTETIPFYQCSAPFTNNSQISTPRANHAHHPSISSVSSYATVPSLSGRTSTSTSAEDNLSIVSPFTDVETPRGMKHIMLPAPRASATAAATGFCAKEIEVSIKVEPVTPSKVGLAF